MDLEWKQINPIHHSHLIYATAIALQGHLLAQARTTKQGIVSNTMFKLLHSIPIKITAL